MTLSSTRTCTLLFAVFASILAKSIATADFYELGNKEELDDKFENERIDSAIGEPEIRVHFELEHQLVADDIFTPRGIVEIVASASFSQPTVSFSSLPTLSVDDLEKLETLRKHGNLYTVRAKADPADPDSPYVMTSVPMCMLLAMRLREDLAFHLSTSGKLLSIEYLTPYLDEDECTLYENRSFEDLHFGPFGTIFKSQAGPMPPKNVIVKRDGAPQGVDPVKNEDNKEESEVENQSFLRKYWYIILPIVVLSLFGGDGGAPSAGPPAAPATGGRRR